MVVYGGSSIWEDGTSGKHKVIGDSHEDKKDEKDLCKRQPTLIWQSP